MLTAPPVPRFVEPPRNVLRRGGAIAVFLGLFVVLALALAVRGSWDPLLAFDAGVTAAAEDAVTDHGALLTAARLVTHLGDPLPVTLGTLLLAGLLLRFGRRRLALLVVLARVGAVTLSGTIKAVVDRARPLFDVPVSEASGLSFPSGHALGAAAFWTVLALALLPLVGATRRAAWALGGAAVGIALLVATSRVLLGVHYLSDVVAGVVLGVGWTVLCAAALRPALRPPLRSRSAP